MSARCKILLADDHKVFLQGLRRILDGRDFEVVGMVQDGGALVRTAAQTNPDIIIADISMPMLNGIEAARQVHKINPRTRLIFLTMHSDLPYAVEAMRAGASAYLVKSADEEELIRAIDTVRRGGTYVTPLMDEALADTPQGRRWHHTSDDLTTRQREVLQLLAEGKQAKEIGNLLNISRRTVEFHKYALMNKLGVKSIPGLAVYAAKHGIVS